jgi:6-phospho-3-hexuloisomerase
MSSHDRNTDTTFSAAAKLIADEIAGVVARIDADEAGRLVERIAAARKVVIAGEGRSGLVGRTFAMRLMQMGVAAYVAGETITPAVGPGDLFIAISGSGRTAATLTCAQSARDAGAEVALVSARREGPLAEFAAQVLVIPGATKGRAAGEATSQQPLSSLFDQALHVAFDALIMLIMRRLGRTEDEMRRAHTNL